MKNPCGCNTCPCHSQVAVLSWEDDQDFTAIRTLNATNYPLLDQRLIDEQPRGTKLVWRIRTLGNPDGFQGKAEYNSGAKTAEIGQVLSIGPIRGGQLVGAGSTQEMYPAETFPGFGAAGFGVGSWLFSGADNGPGGITGNQYVLDIGCVACDCFCANEARVHWGDDDPNREPTRNERQAIYFLGDADDPDDSTGCAPTYGVMIEGTDGGSYMQRFEQVNARFLELASTQLTVFPNHLHLDELDIVLHDHTTPGGSAQNGHWQYNIGNEPIGTGPLYQNCEDVFNVLKDWLDLGNKTLVMNFRGWVTYNEAPPTCDYNEHGPILQAESILGLDLFPLCLADQDTLSAGGQPRTSSTARVAAGAASHLLMANVTSQPHKAVHGGLPVPSGALVLMEADMPVHDVDPLVDAVRWEPVAVLHDLGNGSRIVATVGSWTTGGPWSPSGTQHGFLTEINDAFVTNVISQHGNY